LGYKIPWQDILKDFEFRSETAAMTIEDLATWIESIVEGNYMEFSDGKGDVQVQLSSIWQLGQSLETELPFKDNVSQHLKSGDTVIVDVCAITDSMEAQISEQDIEKIRSALRFRLNDRVVCNCGRWIAGHVVGTAVRSDGVILPYLVKTDKLPGLPSSTISVPEDIDEVCVQEVCFDVDSQLFLVQAAAALVPLTSRPKLRFAVGDKVCCRIRNSPNDGLEQWVSGEVVALWPKAFRDLDATWDMGEASGIFSDVVPYEVVEIPSGRRIYCHRDEHTLIRREGFQPLERVRGVSKRMEAIKNKDGKELIDHVTERRRPCVNDISDSDS
jgi:hypothetical protein